MRENKTQRRLLQQDGAIHHVQHRARRAAFLVGYLLIVIQRDRWITALSRETGFKIMRRKNTFRTVKGDVLFSVLQLRCITSARGKSIAHKLQLSQGNVYLFIMVINVFQNLVD